MTSSFHPPSWLDLPKQPEQRELWHALMEAHAQSADRGNVSGQAVGAAAVGSGDYTKSIAAGLMTLGGCHAPLLQTYSLLCEPDPVEVCVRLLDAKIRVPGWGNSFIRGEDDTLWIKVREWFQTHRGEWWKAKVGAVTEFLHAQGKLIFPNPSTYTAASAIVFELPPHAAAYLFVQGRLSEWTRIYLQHV